MTRDPDPDGYFRGRATRMLWGSFGVLLTALGLCVVFFGVVEPWMRMGAGLAIAAFGVNAVWAAIRGRPPWLARFILFI